ncbi:hypothetical protein M3223_15400 [Paenibacillus pasadenensis]|uniref:hypothetical protein n=1 Tax=Paenibacillus pasadenensis TaxID=217090 RepID=UPI00203E9C07|nr:hypothetical protein [Paenibacillus pasadenensis]MCM3748737.1 hypothetical protein [Paenibacillus pasadenensis]
MNMDKEQLYGSKLGMILVLFILLVIATSLLGPLNNSQSSTASSLGFRIMNQTSYNMIAQAFWGEFENPLPVLRDLPAKAEDHFQVQADKTSIATVRYRIYYEPAVYSTVNVQMIVTIINLLGFKYPSGSFGVSFADSPSLVSYGINTTTCYFY